MNGVARESAGNASHLGVKGKAEISNVTVVLCCRPLDQKDQADEALCRWTGAASYS